ncbi:MAG: 2-dehydropantoate 2-reductase [Methanothrix sp.]|jgi:2-dehydropantoate 2-reductase|nr:2-dehydropantoate 2-reductase [Methanothrix sp.]NLX39264.1 2-dehydropantoate 2-reductase [Methanothrix sp.]HOI69119.1 2-dehydropantoate 2-reductase [Methanothrix sp.]HPY71912.1 2-dehydropantoate 2-reductase [Methanothrix sp.]HQA63166.1 2-dehydropantoate 2-reductase [Methanothrix sp.]
MKALIYGGGAVGLGIASCLILSGAKVDIIAREGTVSALRRGGLERTGIFGSVEVGPERFEAFASLDELLRLGGRRLQDGGLNLDGEFGYDCDYVLVCTKSHGSPAAAADLSRHREILGDGGKIVLFQNGWGNAEIFAEHFPKDQIYSARVITGFSRPEKNVVEVTVHADSIHLGSLFASDLAPMAPLAEAITTGGIPAEVVPEVGKDLWAKMLYNCALNPLGAIFGVPYGDLAEVSASREIMEALIGEIFAVMKAAGYRTHWSTPDEYRAVFYERLLPPTARHVSSTLQDIRAKKSTEIEALSGAVVRLGEEVGVPTPTNATLYRMVKFMEARNLSAGEGNGS